MKARYWQKSAILAAKIKQKDSPNHQNTAKIAPKIGPKSMKNQGCVADAFLERFGAALGAKKATALFQRRIVLGAIFGPKRDFRKYTGALRQPGTLKG